MKLRPTYISTISTVIAVGLVVVFLIYGLCYKWNPREWSAFGSVLSGLATFLGVVGGGWFFWIRWGRGYHVPNLGISIECKRSRVQGMERDWLSIRIELKKHDRGTLTLTGIVGQAIHQDSMRIENLDFWGCKFLKVDEDNRNVSWNVVDENQKWINLTPGEEIQLTHVLKVPIAAALQVNIVVLAKQVGERKTGQWQASAASLPTAPSDALKPTGLPAANH